MNEQQNNLLRQLPSVAKCLADEHGQILVRAFGLGVTTHVIRSVLEEIREAVLEHSISAVPPLAEILTRTKSRAERLAYPNGRKAINATGILLHTGLGRSPLSRKAIEALETFEHYSILEVDIESGERNKREERVERILQELTGCEAATVVNNNAAATFLVLRTLAIGKQVIISRGQLIEIGGSFRMPDVMAQSGCFLKEVGATNKTHLSDYESAISAETGALMHVHTSNYRIHGFASTPSLTELCSLGTRHSIPVIDDLGSGALVPLSPFGLSDEVLVRDSLHTGATLVCFSGDKLICGPQSGIICGRKSAIEKLRKDPFFRMFRPDKMTLAALEATLLHFLNGDEYLQEIPLYQMLSRTTDELRTAAQEISDSLAAYRFLKREIVQDLAYTGGGALPDESLPSISLKLTIQSENSEQRKRASLDELTKKLRLQLPSIFCRIHEGSILLNMRSVVASDFGALKLGLQTVFSDLSR